MARRAGLKDFKVRLRAIFKKNIIRNALTLITGTSIAQAIPIAFVPVLTRLYSPEDFGLFALFIAIISILGVMATARYEVAIMLPERDTDAANIAVLAASIGLVLSLLIFIIVLLASEQIASLLGNSEIAPWLFLAPISVAVIGVYQSANAWATRRKYFNNITVSRITESGATASIQVTLSHFFLTGGLVIGSVLGKLLACGVLLRRICHRDRKLIMGANKILMLENAIKYSAFPKYSVVGAFFDTAAQQLPVLFISRFYNSTTTGHFSLTFRVLSLPITLVSSAIGQVLFQRITELQRNNPDALRGFILGVFALLLLLISPIIPVLWFYSGPLFSFVFGDQWAPAGQMASIMGVAIVVRFAVSPLSGVLALEHNVGVGVAWQVLYFVTMFGTFWLFHYHPIAELILAFVVHEVVLYSIYLFLIVLRCNVQGESS